MPDLCPGCGLDPREQEMLAFLRARLAEHVDDVEQYTSTGAATRGMAIAASDLARCVASVLDIFARSSPERRAALRMPLLVLTQPWMEHPDYAPEWRQALGG